MQNLYFIKEPRGRYFISLSAHHAYHCDNKDCSACLFMTSCSDAWTSNPIEESTRYTKEDAERIIKENSFLSHSVLEAMPETFESKISEIFAKIIKMLIFWQREGKICGYCGSKRLWTHKQYSNEDTLSSVKATCSRCNKDAWSWRD